MPLNKETKLFKYAVGNLEGWQIGVVRLSKATSLEGKRWLQTNGTVMVIYPMTSLHGPSSTLWTMPDSINEASESSQLPVTVTVCIPIHIKVKLSTVVEGDPKAPFSIIATPRCRGGRDSFPWIAPLYPWSVPYNAEC